MSIADKLSQQCGVLSHRLRTTEPACAGRESHYWNRVRSNDCPSCLFSSFMDLALFIICSSLICVDEVPLTRGDSFFNSMDLKRREMVNNLTTSLRWHESESMKPAIHMLAFSAKAIMPATRFKVVSSLIVVPPGAL